MTVNELRDECESRGLEYDGLRKCDLVTLLRNADDEADDNVTYMLAGAELEGRGQDGDGEVEMGGNLQVEALGVDTQEATATDPAGNAQGPGSVQTLKLQIELVKAEAELREKEKGLKETEVKLKEREMELERERAARGNGVSTPTERQNDIAHIHQQLPTMRDDDALNFFLMFERIMELNGVGKESWAKHLGSQLSVKARRAFVRLSNDEAKQL